MLGRIPYSPSRLEEILAEMLKSATAWDEDHGGDVEDTLQDEGLTRIPGHIHCPSLDKRAGQKLSEREDKDGHHNHDGESTMDVRRPTRPSG